MDEAYFNIDILGKLYVVDIFVYYGEPLMFSCKNAFGNLFLVNCLGTSDEYYQWIALPISAPKLLKAKKKLIEARDLFLFPEDDIIWRFIEHFNEDIIKAEISSHKDLNDDNIPRSGCYLEVQNGDSYEHLGNNRLETARNENRAVFDFSIEFNDNHVHEIPTDVLSKALSEIQKLVYSIAHENGGINSKFPKHIIEDNLLLVDSTYAASFGVRFKSDDIADVFGNVKCHNTMKKMIRLLSLKCNKEEIETLLRDLNPKVGKSYEKLLELFKIHNTGYKAYYASPSNVYLEAFATPQEVVKNLELLDSCNKNRVTEINLHGTLVGIDVQRMYFVFVDDNGEKYEGKISDSLDHEKYIVPCLASIELEEIVENNEVINKEIVRYIIKNIVEEN